MAELLVSGRLERATALLQLEELRQSLKLALYINNLLPETIVTW